MASNYTVAGPLDSAYFGSGRFAFGVSVRALFLGALAYGLVEMLTVHRYASVFVLAGLTCVIVFDLARHADKADRILSRFVGALAAGEIELPASPLGGLSGLARLNQAMRGFHLNMAQVRLRQQAEADYLRTLMDTVSAALVVSENGGITRLNRAAHKLSDQKALSPEVVGRLTELSPGERDVIRLGNGQRVLASAAQFFTADRATILLSLQNIESELDAAEIKAWQDLARILAHEMMNSLTPIASLAQSLRPLLAEDAPNARPDILDAVNVIHQRSVGLMGFVERYRAVAELPRPMLREVRLGEIFNTMERLLAPTLNSHNIAYSLTVAPEDLTVMADSQLLEQALINILRNAIEAVATSPYPRIDVACRPDHDHVAIIIEDNGQGIGNDKIEHIFVPFYTAKPGGSGIGLSLARQILTAHGGQIEARQNTTAGMTFRLTLPIT